MASHSKPPPEIPQTDEKPVRPKWADIPALISGIAVFAFVSSTVYVLSIAYKFQLPVRDYLDLIDYVQFLPLYWGDNFIFLLLLIVFVGWNGIIVTRHLDAAHGASQIETPVWEKRTWMAGLLRGVRMLMTIYLLVGGFVIFFDILGKSGDDLTDKINRTGLSQVFRKGQPSPLEGKIFVNGHRYILLLNKEGDLLTAIPQEEVQMIQTQRSGVER
jgi:hypothetical protein